MSTSEEYNGSALRFAGAIILAISIFIGALAVMGTHVGNAEDEPDEMPTAQSVRQDLAVTATRAYNTATALAQTEPSQALTDAAASAHVIVDTLGGVWVPWPTQAPRDKTNPPLATEAPAQPAAQDLVDQFESLADEALAGVSLSEQEDRRTLAAISLYARLTAQNLAATSGQAAPACGDASPALAGQASASGTTLAVADAARQWLEADAAHIAAGNRDNELARIESIARFEEAILANDIDDTRPAFAAYPDLAEGQTLTGAALDALSAQVLQASSEANEDERRALISWTCSLYLTAEERAGFELTPAPTK
ncbi:hypothetical protein I6E29_00405 [Arcanobacterium haemolyticum]|nr:hypothetical protein [Arcanobacterium haemolyticum]